MRIRTGSQTLVFCRQAIFYLHALEVVHRFQVLPRGFPVGFKRSQLKLFTKVRKSLIT
jgi:hypothetical protein